VTVIACFHASRDPEQWQRRVLGVATRSRSRRNGARGYGRVYGMFKTTVYLADELKAALTRVAGETGRSEAELIREGVQLAIERRTPPTPTIGILVSDDPHFAESADDHLAGFGQQ
jgi:Ribbon-helix-helix protein, copG family